MYNQYLPMLGGKSSTVATILVPPTVLEIDELMCAIPNSLLFMFPITFAIAPCGKVATIQIRLFTHAYSIGTHLYGRQ